MQTTVDKLSPTKVKLTVNVPFKELDHAFEHAYKGIAKQVNIPGFRKGKVPSSIIDQRFGRGVVLEEAVNHAVPELYEQACVESNLFPVGQPSVEITEIVDHDWAKSIYFKDPSGNFLEILWRRDENVAYDAPPVMDVD